MDFEFKIRFGKSSSQNYQKAVNQAKKFVNYKPISEDNTFNTVILYSNELRQRYRKIEKLWLLISGWKTTELFVNDEPVEFYDLNKYIAILECDNKYQTSIIPENHCKLYPNKEGWGCQHLNTLSRYSSNYYQGERGSYWYHFGNFQSETIWEIDKYKIKDALRREVKLKKLFLCKIFDFEKVESIVDNLPDKIDLDKSELWEIEYEEIEDGISIEKIPI